MAKTTANQVKKGSTGNDSKASVKPKLSEWMIRIDNLTDENESLYGIHLPAGGSTEIPRQVGLAIIQTVDAQSLVRQGIIKVHGEGTEKD